MSDVQGRETILFLSLSGLDMGSTLFYVILLSTLTFSRWPSLPQYYYSGRNSELPSVCCC